jgi:hypothetical protein
VRPRRHRALLCGPSTSPLAVMSRYLLALLVLITGTSCVPVKTTYYEAVDKPRVAAGTNGNLFPCPPLEGYGVGQIGAVRIVVYPGYDQGRARIKLLMSVWPAHTLTFETAEVQLTSLDSLRVTTSVPLTFYMECPEPQADRYCLPMAPQVRTLKASDKPSPFPTSFTAVGYVPPAFEQGFLVTLPSVFDGNSRIESRALKFELRTGVLSRGLGGCQ